MTKGELYVGLLPLLNQSSDRSDAMEVLLRLPDGSVVPVESVSVDIHGPERKPAVFLSVGFHG